MTRTITVKGNGSYTAKPDYIRLTMTLNTLKKDYNEAVEEDGRKMGNLSRCISKLGFGESDIKTASFDVKSEYESKRDKSNNYYSVFKGFRCRHNIAIEFDLDQKLLGEMIYAISLCISEPDLNISFTVKDKNAVSRELLRSATLNALEKAEIIAEASGVRLGNILSINYNWGEVSVYSNTEFDTDCMCEIGSLSPVSINPEDIKVSDTVTFVWEIL